MSRVGFVASKMLVRLVASYTFCWGFVALGSAILLACGVPSDETQMPLYLPAVVIFLVALGCSLASKRGVHVLFLLAGGGVSMTFAAWFFRFECCLEEGRRWC